MIGRRGLKGRRMSVRPSHQADWCTSHCFWAKSQQQGPRKGLDKGIPSQGGPTEGKRNSQSRLLPRWECSHCFHPCRPWVACLLPTAHGTSFRRQQRAWGLISPPAAIREGCMGHAAWLSLRNPAVGYSWLWTYGFSNLRQSVPSDCPVAQFPLFINTQMPSKT